MKRWKICVIAMMFALLLVACKEDKPAENEPTVTATPTPEETPTPSPKPTSSPTPTTAPIETTIKEVFGEAGLKAGVCLSDRMISNNYFSGLIKEHFNSITLENHMKPDYTLDQNASKAAGELVVNFNNMTKELLKWCKENDMAVRGHTLVWYSQTPSWIFYEGFDAKNALVSRDEMLKRMESYIKQVFEELEELGYLDMIYAYDVVNEAWMEDGKTRDCLWKQVIGEDYLWYAFYYADKYAPEHVDLYYNDYNEQFKTETLYNFVQTLKDENGEYLIDGVGFQAHLYTEDSLEDYFATVDRIGSLGLKVNLTELDVCLGSWPVIKKPTEENLKIQGQYYYNLINGLLQRAKDGTVKMDSLTIWGFSDTLSWRSERSPLLYDSLLRPKYAMYGVLQMKEAAGFDAE